MQPLNKLEKILKKFEQETTDAYIELDEGIDYDRLDEAYKTATQAIAQILSTQETKARLDELEATLWLIGKQVNGADLRRLETRLKLLLNTKLSKEDL